MLLQVAFDDAVDQADVMRFLGARHAAAGDHFERLLDARDARQALGAAGAGEQAQFDLGNAQLGGGNRDPIMAAERDLEPAAQGGAVDRGDHRLGAGFDPVDDFGQPRHHRRLAEFGDVGAGEEGLALAADHDRLDRVIGFGFLDRRDQPLADRGAERVDRRIVAGDDQDVVMLVGRNRGIGHDEGSSLR